jgi:hypothetical protein
VKRRVKPSRSPLRQRLPRESVFGQLRTWGNDWQWATRTSKDTISIALGSTLPRVGQRPGTRYGSTFSAQYKYEAHITYYRSLEMQEGFEVNEKAFEDANIIVGLRTGPWAKFLETQPQIQSSRHVPRNAMEKRSCCSPIRD